MLSIYGNCHSVQSAGQYYRIRTPLNALKKRGLAKVYVDDPFQDPYWRQNKVFTCDVQLNFLTGGKALHKQTKFLTEMKPVHDEIEGTQYPPIIIWDIDDDIQSINPFNPKFCTLATRDDSGELLEPETDFGVRFEEFAGDFGEEPVYLWRHNQMTPHGNFNAGRNIVNHAQIRKMASTAHAITCTGEYLKNRIKDWNPNIFVYPNSITFSDFQKIDVRRPKDDVRVLWQGGYSHFCDFYPLKTAFGKAAAKMPQIKWVILGTKFDWVMKEINPFRIEFHPWVAHQLFWMKMATLSYDIAIAPLADTVFNPAKSAIKFYESAALRVPIVAQNVGPFKEIIDGETGMLFNDGPEFVEKLEMLVKDPELRRKIGNNAYDWVREYRDAEKTCEPLLAFYEETLTKARG